MNFVSSQYSKYNNTQSSGFQRTRPNTTKPFCPICKKNGRPESEYNSHFIRETSDENSPITCPILQNIECNHCGDKGHISAKCPNKKCVYCNQYGHTVSRCTADSQEVINRFLDQRHQSYERRRENVFQRQVQVAPAPAPAPVTPSISAMFEDAPSLSKKPIKSNAVAPVVSYSNVAEIAAPLAVPKKKVAEVKVENNDDYEDDSDEDVQYNDDEDSVHSDGPKRNGEDMTLKEKLMSYYEEDSCDW